MNAEVREVVVTIGTEEVTKYQVLYWEDESMRIVYDTYDTEDAANEVKDLIESGDLIPPHAAYQSEIDAMINEAKEEAEAIIESAEGQSKSKLILTVRIGVDNHSLAYFDKIVDCFNNKFDDSVTVITMPIVDRDDIVLETLNTSNYTEAEVNAIITQANSLLAAFKDR